MQIVDGVFYLLFTYPTPLQITPRDDVAWPRSCQVRSVSPLFLIIIVDIDLDFDVPSALVAPFSGGTLVCGGLVGEGGFGRVYKAQFRGLEVAAKQLHYFRVPSTYGISTRGSFVAPVREIQQELRALRSLVHPCIVRLRGVVTDQVSFSAADVATVPMYILMDFVYGGTLENILGDRNRMSEAGVTAILTQVALAVNYIHSRDFIHRDLKPQNVMVDIHNRVKVADFGLAKVIVGPNVSPNVYGTPCYMAPEVMSGVYEKSVDIYSLGCMVLAMLARVHPGREHHDRIATLRQLQGSPAHLVMLATQCIELVMASRPTALQVLHALGGV